MHIFQCCALILFGFGLEEIFRGCVEKVKAQPLGLIDQLKAWWKNAPAFERKWTYGAAGFGILSLLLIFIYISSNREMTQYLTTGGFTPEQIPKILEFSVHELWIYIAYYAISLFFILVALSGWFCGQRWKVATAVFGIIIFTDLARANLPWIQYYNYKERYTSNPVIDILRANAYERRVSFKIAPFGYREGFVDTRQFPWWEQLYSIWLQNQFQYYNIAALEPIQMPRPPEVDLAFIQNFFPRTNSETYLFPRFWELTGTRFFLGQTAAASARNQELDPVKNRIHVHTPFEIVPKATAKQDGSLGIDDITAQLSTNGTFGILEFTGALPRVKLFNQWQIPPNDEVTLQILRAPDFDPSQKVLIAPGGEAVPAPGPVTTNATASAKFTRYAPKEVEVQAESSSPGVLLMNDKYSPNWKVWVDGQPATLLRCNFIMRGVYLTPGQHKVEFKYRPPTTTLYVTISAIVAAALILGFLGIERMRAFKTNNK